MPSRDSKYYFGRLNIISAYDEGKKAFLERGLKSDSLVHVRNYSWGFFEVEDISEQDDYLSGFLIRYRPFDPEQFVNTETREIEEQEIRNRINAKSRFFLHVRTGIIAYQVVGEVNETSFRKNFTDILEQSYDNFFVSAEIQPINQEQLFFDAVKRFEAITKISIYLHPSNPSSRDVWKNADERFKKLKLKTYTEIYTLEDSNKVSSIKEDEEINSKLHMASDGYGKAKVRGKRGEGYETISTGDNPVEAEVEGSVENADSPGDILREILPTFRSLFKRVQS